jgi:hypothetical protein
MSCAACSQLKGERFMHSIDHYDTLRRGREELLRQAEQERMARAALLKRKTNWTFHRSALIRLTNAAARLVLRTQVRRKEKVANWLGIHLVRWGKKLERFGTFAEA